MPRPLPLCFLVACLGACASSPHRNPQQAQLHFEVGVGFLQDGRYPDSLAEFEKAQSLDPDQATYRMHVGLAYYKMGLFPKAEETIGQACRAQTPYPECWYNLAIVALEAKKPKLAAAHARKALETVTYSSPEGALAVLARAETELKHFPEARQNIARALRLAPNNCALRNVLSLVLVRAQDFEAGLEEARRTAFLCRADSAAQLWEAYAFYKIGQRGAAQARFERIHESFRQQETVDAARVALERLKKRVPLDEPRL